MSNPAQAVQSGLTWPLATIDFEASSLEWDGYPIEVGIAVWHALDAPIFGWSSLIRPTLAWREGGHWSRTSAEVHGIAMSDLQAHGRPVREVAGILSALLAPSGTVWCDGGDYDAGWLKSLFEAGQAECGFVLRDWTDLLSGWDDAARHRAGFRLTTTTRHRAGADAERLMLAVAAGLGAPEPLLRTLPEPET